MKYFTRKKYMFLTSLCIWTSSDSRRAVHLPFILRLQSPLHLHWTLVRVICRRQQSNRWHQGPDLQNILRFIVQSFITSVLWRCWLGGRKGFRPVKTEWWGAGVVVCLERGADLHTAQLMPLPLTVSCFSKVQIGFTFLVPAHPGSPGQRAVKRVCVLSYNYLKFIVR